MTANPQKPFLGFGLGLRAEHYQEILERKPKSIDWLEIISENYMIDGGKPLYFLDAIRAHYPMVMHGVSMSLGSTDELDYAYLQRLKTLIETYGLETFSAATDDLTTIAERRMMDEISKIPTASTPSRT